MTFALITIVLVSILVVLSYIDARTYRLPDKLTVPLIGLGLISSWIIQANVWLHLLGALVGYLAFVLIEKAYLQIRRRPGLGRGDAKLLAAGGAWCGVFALPIIVLIASVAGLAVVLLVRALGASLSSRTPIAFGPFLSVGILAVWILEYFR